MMFLMSYFFKPLAYVSLPVFVLKQVMEYSPPLLRSYIRIGLYLSTLSVCSVWGMICSITMPFIGQKYNVNWVVARTFHGMVQRIVDIKFEVEGAEILDDTRPAVLVCNHQSMVDVAMLGSVFPKYAVITAKKELKWSPLLGQFLSLSGAIFVDRGNSSRAVQSLSDVGEVMKANNISVWLFAEGTRSMREHPDMLPFKKGAFHIAVQAGVPVIPIVVENYWRLYRQGIFEGGVVKVKVLPPVDTKHLTSDDVNDLSVRVREMMVKTMRDISVSVPASTQPTEKPAAATLEKPTVSEPPKHPDPEPLVAAVPPPAENDASSLPRAESRASTIWSEGTSSPTTSRRGESENGIETEEDEGMVLVGRPQS